MEIFASDKYPNLLDMFMSYEENEVLWIRIQDRFLAMTNFKKEKETETETETERQRKDRDSET